MLNIYDGTDTELSYGQALVLLASAKGVFPNEPVQNQIVLAIQREHGLVPPPPDVLVQPLDPRDQTLRNQDAELALLRAELARRDKLDADAEGKAAEIAALRARLAPSPAAPAARDAELATRTTP
jgi:hypothetical protein